MKKSILTLIFAMIASIGFSQPNMNRHFFKHRIDISQYVTIDTLVIDKIYIPSMFDYDEDKVLSIGYNEYIIEAPHKDKMVIKTNKDRTKAIVLYNSYIFGRHKEFNVEENEKRIVLWYKDEDLYCGYAYDKKYKVCKYFEKIEFQDFNRIMFQR